MNKVKTLLGKISLIKVFSLAFMCLGIGCVAFAVFSIWSQSNINVKANPSHISLPATTMVNKRLYHVYPKEGDSIGTLTMQSLNQKLPIVQGTGENDLKKGVGHFTQSILPGEKDNCVLSGHRDTVFSKIGKLKIGIN